jgi:hypothetical protein
MMERPAPLAGAGGMGRTLMIKRLFYNLAAGLGARPAGARLVHEKITLQKVKAWLECRVDSATQYFQISIHVERSEHRFHCAPAR